MSSTSLSSSERCLQYRRRILEISQRGPAHVAPALSCLEIVDLIYHELKRPQDSFILSKGHGAIAQYVVLEDLGLMNLDEFCNGSLGGHPDRGGPIEASTGSLGHGLGIGVGMAYAEYLKGTDNRVYVIISDGELQEGSLWEAVQMAANLKLDNLIVFVDLNDFGGLERISHAHPAVYPVPKKFIACGWESFDSDGHDVRIMRNLCQLRLPDRPFALVCRTVKGKGVSYMEARPGMWHYRSPSVNEYKQALEELVA